jgi:hypothetical protein
MIGSKSADRQPEHLLRSTVFLAEKTCAPYPCDDPPVDRQHRHPTAAGRPPTWGVLNQSGKIVREASPLGELKKVSKVCRLRFFAVVSEFIVGCPANDLAVRL